MHVYGYVYFLPSFISICVFVFGFYHELVCVCVCVCVWLCARTHLLMCATLITVDRILTSPKDRSVKTDLMQYITKLVFLIGIV